MSHTLQTPWYTKTINALQLAGKGDRTQECYARSVRQLLEYVNKDPLQITEQELKDYFLFRRNTSIWSASTLNICYCGLGLGETPFIYSHSKYPLCSGIDHGQFSRLC